MLVVVPVSEYDSELLIVGRGRFGLGPSGVMFCWWMDYERCPKTIDVLTMRMSVCPIGSPLPRRVDRDMIVESLAGWNSTLRYAHSAVHPARRVEEHSVMMKCGRFTERVRDVDDERVSVVDLENRRRPCPIDANDSTREEAVGVSVRVGDVPPYFLDTGERDVRSDEEDGKKEEWPVEAS